MTALEEYEKWREGCFGPYLTNTTKEKADAALEELVTTLEKLKQVRDTELLMALARAEAAEANFATEHDALVQAEADLAAMTENHRQAMIGIGELNDDLARAEQAESAMDNLARKLTTAESMMSAQLKQIQQAEADLELSELHADSEYMDGVADAHDDDVDWTGTDKPLLERAVERARKAEAEVERLREGFGCRILSCGAHPMKARYQPRPERGWDDATEAEILGPVEAEDARYQPVEEENP